MARFIMYDSHVAQTVRLWVAYIAGHTSGLHCKALDGLHHKTHRRLYCKAQMLVEAWRGLYLVLTIVLVIILDSGVP
jgi:uncharacterized membrane protein